MSFRKMGIALFAVCASLLLVPVAASAATGSTGIATKTLKTIAMSGHSKNGKKFTGHFTFERFATRGGKTYAVGTLTGKLGHRSVNKSNVFIPAHV